MAIRIKTGVKTLGVAAAVAAALILGTGGAVAANTTYTPNGGPAVSFNSTNASFTDTTSSLQPVLNCTTFNLPGTINNPGTSRAYGTTAGTLTGLNSSGCTNSILGSANVTPTGTWTVSIDGDATGTVWPASLHGVTANVGFTGCNFTVGDGSGGGATITGTFNTANQQFTPTGSTLEINAGSLHNTGILVNCNSADLANYDSIAVGGLWTNVPPTNSTPITITNP